MASSDFSFFFFYISHITSMPQHVGYDAQAMFDREPTARPKRELHISPVVHHDVWVRCTIQIYPNLSMI